MAKRVRRVIRKVKPSLIATIDDQLWPINIVLLILGGFITGEVLVFGDFTTPAVLQNGWTWLTWVWFAVIGTMLLAWKYGGRTARRTQLSGALALVFTLFLLTACYYFEIFAAVAIDDVPRDVAKKEEVVQPDFVQLQEIQRQQIQLDHHKPVETEVTEEQQLEVEQQTVEGEQPVRKQKNEAEPVPQPTRQAEPSPRQLSQPRRSTPRQANTTGQLSRQVQPNEAQPEKVASPSVAQQDQPKPAAKVDAQTQALAPRKTTATTQRPNNIETPTTQSQQPKLRNARRPTPSAEQPQLSTSRPTLRRAVRQPLEIPKVQQVAQQQPAASQQLESS
ncbi:MAG: hypothetical protein OES79_11910, partial [Planctomycetota bacterium]|nr:hypothetical protein [Planctomycetota bacterium]